jgi:hypothetical protein
LITTRFSLPGASLTASKLTRGGLVAAQATSPFGPSAVICHLPASLQPKDIRSLCPALVIVLVWLLNEKAEKNSPITATQWVV